MPKFWYLRNPFRYEIIMTRGHGVVTAEFPALPHCSGEGSSIDEALLSLAKRMQAILETPHEHGPKHAA